MSGQETHIDQPDKPAPTTNSLVDQQEKVDIKKLVAVVPPPTTLFAKGKKAQKEKRIRLAYDASVSKDEAKISKALADELGIRNHLEITVAGKKRFRFRAVILDSLPNDVVHVNSEVMKLHGVADKSICTIRSAD
ncbi:MAG: hypothetical protein QXL96_11060 [Ignisphaera sp.]